MLGARNVSAQVTAPLPTNGGLNFIENPSCICQGLHRKRRHRWVNLGALCNIFRARVCLRFVVAPVSSEQAQEVEIGEKTEPPL